MGTALTGGVVGGSLVFLAAYGYYHFSGAKTMVNSLHQTKSYFDNVSLRGLSYRTCCSETNAFTGNEEAPERNTGTQ